MKRVTSHGRGRAHLVLLIKEALEVSNFEQTWPRSGRLGCGSITTPGEEQ
jgi:hypothetical protein